jgi:hypothetical protein
LSIIFSLLALGAAESETVIDLSRELPERRHELPRDLAIKIVVVAARQQRRAEPAIEPDRRREDLIVVRAPAQHDARLATRRHREPRLARLRVL